LDDPGLITTPFIYSPTPERRYANQTPTAPRSLYTIWEKKKTTNMLQPSCSRLWCTKADVRNDHHFTSEGLIISEAAAVDWNTAAAMKTAQLNNTRTATPVGMSNPSGAAAEDVLGGTLDPGDAFPLLLGSASVGDQGMIRWDVLRYAAALVNRMGLLRP